MILIFQLLAMALVYMFLGAYLIGSFLVGLVSNVGSNKITDVIKIVILSICIVFLFGLGSYMDILCDNKNQRVGEDYLLPCLLYSIVILVALSIFYRHKNTKKTYFIESFFGDFTPSIPILKNTAYIFIISFILESVFRLVDKNSIVKCFWIFQYYVPSTLEEKLKLSPANECSYYILIFSSICLILMLYSDLHYNKNKCFRSLIIAFISMTLIFGPINAYRHNYYYIPANYNINNNILKDCDIELLSNNIGKNVFVDKVPSLGGITLGESWQKVDREIKNYINSIEKDSIAYIFDNATYISCISCTFDEKKLQVISFKLGNCNFSNREFGRKFVANRDYALDKKDEFVRMEFDADIDKGGYNMFDYLYTTQPTDSKNWDSAIATISKKYGAPLLIGTELDGKFTIEGKRTYFWVADAKIIKFHIYRDSAACLSYIKSSFISGIVHDKALKEKEEIEWYNKSIIEERQMRQQDSIEKINKEKEDDLKKREISNKTFEDI